MSKKRKKSSKSGNFKQTLEQQIISIFQQNPTLALNYKRISKALGIKDVSNKKLISFILQELTENGVLIESQRGAYKLKVASQFVEGKVDMTQSGAAYVVVEDTETDIYIHAKNTKNALNGDIVKVNVFPAKKNSTKLEGEIVEIVERAKSQFIGIVQKSKNFAFFKINTQRFSVFINVKFYFYSIESNSS